MIRARTKGLPPEVPAIAIKLSERDHQRERHRYEQPKPPPEDLYYNSQPSAPHRQSTKIPHHRRPYRQELPTHQQYTASRRREEPQPQEPRWIVTDPVVTDQPTKVCAYQPSPLRAEDMEPLADTRVHTFYTDDTRTRDERYEPHHRRTRSMVPPSRGGAGYDIESTSPLRRSTGMLRTESDYRMPPTRRSFHVSPTIHHRGRVRRYEEPPRSSGILRRRGAEGGIESASDTEVQDYWTMGSSRRTRYGSAHYGGRSNSLPRSLRSGYHRQAVRFTSSLPYDSQEESDGAVSAPELPATRPMRRREYPPDFFFFYI